MATSASILSVCNLALLAIGSQVQVSNLNEGTPQANACNQLFQMVYAALARSANWNCLRAQTSLTLYAAAQGTSENTDGTTLPLPPSPWLYEYLQPTSMLQLRFLQPTLLVPSTGVPIFSVNTGAPTFIQSPGQIPYVVAYDTDSDGNALNVILTNQTQAVAVYTVNQPNPQLWDSLFLQAMVASLAAWLVPALNLNLPFAQMQVQTAEKLIEQARVRDGNEGVTSMDHTPDFIRARSGATGSYWNRNGSNYTESWGAMSWPSY